MNILSLDSSSKNFSIAICDDEKVLFSKNLKIEKALAESIIPAIDSVLKNGKVSLCDVDGFSIGLGPGSFTSLRVGLATIKAFCLALKKPVVGISSLDVIAQGVKDLALDKICVLSDAKRNMVFSSIYKVKNNCIERVSSYFLCDVKNILKRIKGECVFVGDGVKIFENEIKSCFKDKKNKILFADEEYNYAQAVNLTELSVRRFKKRKIDNSITLAPMYLYSKDCQVRK